MVLARRLASLFTALVIAVPVTLAAQAPFNACVDRTGALIPSKTNNKMGYGGMAGYEDDKPVIWWNKHNLDNAAEYQQLFLYMHECAHHTLGHIWGDQGLKQPGIDEIEADCWGLVLMVEAGMIGPFQLDSLYIAEGRKSGDGEHLGGDEQVRSLRRCLSIRTDPDAWAAALPPIIQAAQAHFTGIRGRELEAAEGRDSIWESTLDLPGTYDCEVMGSRRLRCIVFVSKNQKPAVKRYEKLRDILTEWEPDGWSHVENPSPKPPFATAFHMQDASTGVVMSLLLSQDAKLYFVTTAPQQ